MRDPVAGEILARCGPVLSRALGPWALGPGPLGPWALAPGPWALGPLPLGPWALAPGPWALGPLSLGPWALVPGPLGPWALGLASERFRWSRCAPSPQPPYQPLGWSYRYDVATKLLRE